MIFAAPNEGHFEHRTVRGDPLDQVTVFENLLRFPERGETSAKPT
jgi:hypothetical protein